ncbi:hypothetical protein CL617_05350 [archaeon]|nr:hypothetical protein [archaeon]|tara:strand:+ start:3734 stop:4573 length:840 start_codon:yes stop_codon:yes gene_type:complete
MVLESLISPLEAGNKLKRVFVFGFIYSVVGAFLALWIFRSNASLVMVFLTVIASIPLMYLTLRLEEKKDRVIKNEKILIKSHGKALKVFMFLFFGMIIGYSLLFIFMPSATTDVLFQTQTDTIKAINANISGNAISGNATIGGILLKIILNNVKVLFFTVLFAFFYGAGAIFILTWNASVIGAAVGNFVNARVLNFIDYFHVIPLGIMRYMTHGVFEILAYFIGGLAGGIISVAVINHDIDTDNFKNILKDSVDLILLALVVIIFAGLIEVFVTPVFFS